jgi:hypothetical protein
MADLVLTATLVVPGAGAKFLSPGTAPPVLGATLTAGKLVYQKASDSKIYGALANSGNTPAPWPETVLAGILVNGGNSGQAAQVQVAGVVNVGATTVKGMFYVVSPAAAGGIAPIADLLTAQTPAHYVTVFGQALDTAGNIQMGIQVTGVPM